jgi:hypothetical protein
VKYPAYSEHSNENETVLVAGRFSDCLLLSALSLVSLLPAVALLSLSHRSFLLSE